MSKSSRLLPLTVLLICCSLLSAAAVIGASGALASDSSGVTPVSPANGKTLTAGKPFTFKVRSPAGHSVFLTVSTSKRRGEDGVLASNVYFRQMHRSHGLYIKKTDRYAALPSYFLNHHGRYYWQAHYISCDGVSTDCNVEGPIRSFRIR
jgi:hypothetical protein